MKLNKKLAGFTVALVSSTVQPMQTVHARLPAASTIPTAQEAKDRTKARVTLLALQNNKLEDQAIGRTASKQHKTSQRPYSPYISQTKNQEEKGSQAPSPLTADEQTEVFNSYMKEMSTLLDEMKVAEGDEIWAGLNRDMNKIKERWARYVYDDLRDNVEAGRPRTLAMIERDHAFKWKVLELIPYWQTSYRELWNTERNWIKDMGDPNMPAAAVKILKEKTKHIPTIQKLISKEGDKLLNNPNPNKKERQAFFERLSKASKFVENTEAATAPLFNAEIGRAQRENEDAVRRMNRNPTWRYLTGYFSVMRTVGPPGFNCRWGFRGDFSCSDGKGIYSRGPQW
jgi:hypothetical protein